jgi:hypothetical protein
MSHTQFDTARMRGDDAWVYVVDNARTAPRVHAINDPAGKVVQYVFDDGWHVMAERPEAPRRALPGLNLPTSRDDLVHPCPVIDANGSHTTPIGWIECAHPAHDDSWYAVRIEGDSLGLANRGGLAIIQPIDHEPEDDDLVLVILHDQVDPDTGRSATIRYWRPERDLHGNDLAVRLWSNGSVEPLTVHNAEAIEVCGLVRSHISAATLAERGYLADP